MKKNIWMGIKIMLAGLAITLAPILASAAGIDFNGAVTSSGINTVFTGGIGPACEYLGAAIIIFGAIQLGFSFRSDDAEGKTKATRSLITGALVATLGAGIGTPGTPLAVTGDFTELNPIIQLIGSACVYIGAALTLFGAIQIAFAFRNDEAEGKAKGMRSALAGVLVLAVGVVAQSFAG